jgi:hypothetical protein
LSNFVFVSKISTNFSNFFEEMESSQNENVMIIDDENEGLNECNMENEKFDELAFK